MNGSEKSPEGHLMLSQPAQFGSIQDHLASIGSNVRLNSQLGQCLDQIFSFDQSDQRSDSASTVRGKFCLTRTCHRIHRPGCVACCPWPFLCGGALESVAVEGRNPVQVSLSDDQIRLSARSVLGRWEKSDESSTCGASAPGRR